MSGREAVLLFCTISVMTALDTGALLIVARLAGWDWKPPGGRPRAAVRRERLWLALVLFGPHELRRYADADRFDRPPHGRQPAQRARLAHAAPGVRGSKIS